MEDQEKEPEIRSELEFNIDLNSEAASILKTICDPEWAKVRRKIASELIESGDIGLGFQLMGW